MKICLISYDFWHYDQYIVQALKRKRVDAHHIRITSWRYPNLKARVKNTTSKVFLGKNLKNTWRQNEIISQLENLGPQDQILVINPESISPEFHQKIKKFTKKYIAYLYDALARNPAEHVLPFFDEIFSFDQKDAAEHGFQHIQNYIYLPREKPANQAEIGLTYLGSFDERMAKLYTIADQMHKIEKTYAFYIVGKQGWKKTFENDQAFTFLRKKIPLESLPDYYRKAAAILDLVRENQTGLSFRIFEAMALGKKIVTTNPNIRTYEFYHPANILVLDENMENLTSDFFEKPMAEIPDEIYQKFTIEHWVDKVFNLK